MTPSDKVMTADDAWLLAIWDIQQHGQSVEPQKSVGARDRVSFEIINHTMSFDMKQPVVTVKPNTSWIYMAAEPMWVIEGSGNLNYFPEIHRIQLPYSNNGVTVYGSYGPRYKSQRNNVIERLNEDRGTRQAVMTLWRKNPPLMIDGIRLKDIPCTVALQWLIRDNVIHTIVTMRSSDAGLGLPYDMLTFTCMTADIASTLDDPPELGTCYINAGSRHIYEDQWDSLDVDAISITRYKYAPWNIWKWTAIKTILKRIAAINTFDLNRRDVQAECFKAIMEVSSGSSKS